MFRPSSYRYPLCPCLPLIFIPSPSFVREPLPPLTVPPLFYSPPIPRSFRLRDDKSDDPLQCGGNSGPAHHSPAKKRALTPTPPPPTSLLHHLNAQLAAAAAAAAADTSCNGGVMVHGSPTDNHNINNNNNNNNTASSSKAKRQPNHGEGPGRRKRKGELDKLMEDKKVTLLEMNTSHRRTFLAKVQTTALLELGRY